jgi:hypothetical protein
MVTSTTAISPVRPDPDARSAGLLATRPQDWSPSPQLSQIHSKPAVEGGRLAELVDRRLRDQASALGTPEGRGLPGALSQSCTGEETCSLVPMTADRSLIARLAAHESWARTSDPSARTEPARRTLLDPFRREVDPDGALLPDERARRAAHARKAYFARLALWSAQARRRKSKVDP